MAIQELFEQVLLHKDEILHRGSPRGADLLKQVIKIHPADIAEFLERLDISDAFAFFSILPRDVQVRTFHEVGHSRKVALLELLSEYDRSVFLGLLSIDDLTDFFEDLSDVELKSSLRLLHKKDRERVLSLLRFDPESAGGMMYTDVLTLMQDFTVEKSIHILQRLRPSRSLHHKIYVTNQNNELVGHINLEDLVLKSPKTRLSSILRQDELIVHVNEDRQVVANKMVHYGVSNVPVVGADNTFLGAIPSEALVEIIEEEATEDIYRMSALSPSKYTYFETSFGRLLYQRSLILMVLLLVQTFSTMILRSYEQLLYPFLFVFISMLTSTGGNASSQTSALAIQGIATGEIDLESSSKFIRREFAMALIIGVLLSVLSFFRIYGEHYFFGTDFKLIETIAVSGSLMVIVLASIALGSAMPFVLQRIGVDPAHSAGPLLTTVIDVIGLLLYCLVSSGIIYVLS